MNPEHLKLLSQRVSVVQPTPLQTDLYSKFQSFDTVKNLVKDEEVEDSSEFIGDAYQFVDDLYQD
jgi:hypothetical protein